MTHTSVRASQPAHRRRGFRAAVVSMAFLLTAAACGGSDGDSQADGTVPGASGENTPSTAAPDVPDLPAFKEGAAVPNGKPGGTLRVAHWFPPLSLDPHTGSSGADHQVLYSMYDRLVHFEFATLEFLPGLAKSWTFPDPQTIEMKLQEGVKFHDGTPFDAEAVKYNVNRTKNLPTTKIKGDLASVDTVEVVDPLTVRLKLNKPDSGVIGVLADRAGMMVSPTAAEAATGKQLDNTPVGTGPFKLADYQPGVKLTLAKNPDYWQKGLPYLDGIDWIFSGDFQSGLNGLRAGDIDVATTLGDGSQVADLESDPNLKVLRSPSLNTEGCYINDEIAPWNDVRVRKAFSMALDRESLAKALTFGLGRPAYLPVPPEHWSSSKALIPNNAFDLEGAKKLLAEAGQPTLPVKILLYQDPVQIRKGEAMQQSLNKAGFQVELVVQQLSAAVPAMFTDKQFPIFCAPWTGRPDPSQTVTSLFAASGYYSVRETDRNGLDALISASVASGDVKERAAAYEKVWKLAIADEALWTPFYHNTGLAGTRKAVAGLQLNLLGKTQVQFAYLES